MHRLALLVMWSVLCTTGARRVSIGASPSLGGVRFARARPRISAHSGRPGASAAGKQWQRFPPHDHVLDLCRQNRSAEALTALRDLERTAHVPIHLYTSMLISCMDNPCVGARRHATSARAARQSADRGPCPLANHPRAAEPIVERMWAGDLRPDEGAYSTLVRIFVHWNQLRRALRVLVRMRRAGMAMRRRTVVPVLDRLCELGQSREATRFWLGVERYGITLTDADYARLVRVCGANSDLEHIGGFLARLRDKGPERISRRVRADLIAGLTAARLPSGAAAYHVATVRIGEHTGICPNCRTRLSQLRLDADERDTVRVRLLERAAQVDESGTLLARLLDFDAWLTEHPRFNCLIDGPNVVCRPVEPDPAGFPLADVPSHWPRDA